MEIFQVFLATTRARVRVINCLHARWHFLIDITNTNSNWVYYNKPLFSANYVIAVWERLNAMKFGLAIDMSIIFNRWHDGASTFHGKLLEICQ